MRQSDVRPEAQHADKLGDFVRTYWLPIAAAVAVAIAWGGNTVQGAWTRSDVALTRADIGAMRQDNKEILAKLDKLFDKQADMASSLSAERATAVATGVSVGELRDRVRALEARR